MKLAIGDIHGRNDWKKYINEDFEECYFVGDYFDNFENTPTHEQVENFLEIADLAKKDSRIKLCLGNHDLQYLKGCSKARCSGFQFYTFLDIQEALEANMDLIKPIYVTDGIIISHAGLTKTFMFEHGCKNPLDVNDLFKYNRMTLSWAGYDNYGDSIYDGPLWVRPRSLLQDKLDGYKQIVGYTHMKDITTTDDVTFIDVELKDVYRF